MRYTYIPLFLATAIATVQCLTIPDQSPPLVSVIENPLAAPELGSLVRRAAFTCTAKDQTKCTTCPTATHTKAKTGRALDARTTTEVPMDGLSAGTWAAGDTVETRGLSACTVMAVWDQNNFVMAHIPPARASKGVLAFTSMEVIKEYEARLTNRFAAAKMQNPQGYLLVSSMMGAEEKQAMVNWFASSKVQVTTKDYSSADYVYGQGNFVLSREGNAWPPKITFA